MRLFSLVFPLLLRSGIANTVYTLSEVEAQISSYQAHHIAYAAASTLPSGCQLAVSFPNPEYHLDSVNIDLSAAS
jgi:hypothetical protein